MHSFLTPVNTNSVKYNNAEIPPNMSTVDNKGKTGFTSKKITFVLENVVHIGMQRTQPEISTSSGNKKRTTVMFDASDDPENEHSKLHLDTAL